MPVKLDDIDKDILKLLEKNAKMRIHSLASKLYLPASTVHHRIKSLEKAGIIKRWTIEKDHLKMGLPLKAYLLVKMGGEGLQTEGRTPSHIAAEIAALGGIEYAELLSGDSDILACARATTLLELKQSLVLKVQKIKGVSSVNVLAVAGP